eukprot:Hpha_TRINITY_DN12477_c0_g1::TRINITY_DN12477_c0_g1_i2::g.42914::m.42914
MTNWKISVMEREKNKVARAKEGSRQDRRGGGGGMEQGGPKKDKGHTGKITRQKDTSRASPPPPFSAQLFLQFPEPLETPSSLVHHHDAMLPVPHARFRGWCRVAGVARVRGLSPMSIGVTTVYCM